MREKMSDREKRAYRALVRRRLKIADECRQIRMDIESYNDNNPWGDVIDVPNFDFTKEVIKARAAESSAQAADD